MAYKDAILEARDGTPSLTHGRMLTACDGEHLQFFKRIVAGETDSPLARPRFLSLVNSALRLAA